MATYSEIKNKVHDGSGIKNPYQWNWYTVGGIWYPEYLLPEQDEAESIIAREQAIQQAKDLLKKEGFIIRYWHKDDLNGHFEEGQTFADKPKLTAEEIENIVRYLENIDAEIGINHHSVFDTIENELSNREEN